METYTQPTTTVLVLSSRKPGTTPEEFKAYYEDKHVPFIEKLLMQGDLAPLSYTRHYIARDPDPQNDNKAASFPFQSPEGWGSDCIASVVFRDPAHRDALFAAFAAHREEILVDEAKFLDSSTLKMIYITESPTTVPKA